MTEKELLDQAPLYAVGTLDGEDRAAFERALAGSEALRAEVASFERTLARVAMANASVTPSAATRERVMNAAQPRQTIAAASLRPSSYVPLALAAAVIVGLGLTTVRLSDQRNDATQRAESAEAKAAAMIAANEDLKKTLARAEIRVAELASINRLLASPGTSVLKLGGNEMSKGWGSAILNVSSKDAALLISDLAPLPEGKVYQAWILGPGAPVPAGTFTVEGSFRLVWLEGKEAESRVQGVAVSIEPKGGVPAPTGAIVLVTKS